MTTELSGRRCAECGVHRAGYQTGGDEVVDLCACCYGEPYDPAECAGQPPKGNETAVSTADPSMKGTP